MSAETTEPIAKRRGSIIWGVLLIVIGLLFIAMPLITGEIIAIFVGWLILVSGLLHLINAIHHFHLRSSWLKGLVGLCYLGLGAYILVYPLIALGSLTLLLGTFLVI